MDVGVKEMSYVVTGANRGIGFAICETLLRLNPRNQVFVGARKLGDAKTACAELGERTVPFEVDLNNDSSIMKFAEAVPQFDVLINNAGHAFHGDAFDVNVAKETIGPNFFGTRSLTYALLARQKIRERIITVTSTAGL